MQYTTDIHKKFEQVRQIDAIIKQAIHLKDRLLSDHCPCSGEPIEIPNIKSCLKHLDDLQDMQDMPKKPSTISLGEGEDFNGLDYRLLPSGPIWKLFGKK